MELIVFLILLYVLQLLFGRKKKEQDTKRQRQDESAPERQQEDMFDWEKELEHIFGGPKPSEEPVFDEVKTPTRTQDRRREEQSKTTLTSSSASSGHRSSRQSRELERQKELAEFSRSKGDLGLGTDNPLLKKTDEEERERDAMLDEYPFLRNLGDSKAMADAIILKEILDRPKALRRDARIF